MKKNQCNEVEFFDEIKQSKKELVSEINTLLKNFESKFKHIGVAELKYVRFNGADEDYTGFVRVTDILLYFSLDKCGEKTYKEPSKDEKRG